MRIRVLLLAVCVLSVNYAMAQEVIDNTEFTSWSKFPKGTSVTLKMNSKAAGVESETSVTTRLLEVGAEKLVLESTTVLKTNGMEFTVPPMKRDVEKKLTLPKGVKQESLKGGKPEGTFEEGTQTLKISGKDVKTKWYRYKNEQDGITTEAKIWHSDEIPGLMVKMESTTKGPVESTTKMEIVEFKKP